MWTALNGLNDLSRVARKGCGEAKSDTCLDKKLCFIGVGEQVEAVSVREFAGPATGNQTRILIAMAVEVQS